MTFKGFKINFDLSNGTTVYGYISSYSKMDSYLGLDFDFASFKRDVLFKLPNELKNKGELRYYWVDTHGDKIDIVDPYDYQALLEMACSELSQVYVGLKKSSISQMDLPAQPIPNKPLQRQSQHGSGFFRTGLTQNQSVSTSGCQPSIKENTNCDSEQPKFIKITYNLLNGTKFSRYFDTKYFDKYNMEGYLFQDLKQLNSHKLRYYWIDSHGEEVDIVQTSDYEACRKATSIPHIYIVPASPPTIEKDNHSTTTNNTTSRAAYPTTFEGQLPKTNVSHDANNIPTNVKCDSCVMEPIVGYRYKCIQYPKHDDLMILKPNVDGEKAKESDRYKECSHVHQSFLTHLYDMMNNLIKDIGKVETAAGTTKIPTANIIQDSNCKITLGCTTYTGGQNVDEISVKEGIIEDKVIHETSVTKESDSMNPIDCEQMEMDTTAVTGDCTSNNRIDSVTTNTEIPEKNY
ncbi:uncharacterized protein [Musca autumnalis]|uniref:uncharacterized protein n=1 Tax=Musca autumnalis TaxID=221902 RepID=UPI003CFAF0AD